MDINGIIFWVISWIVLMILAYRYLTKHYKFWEKQNLPYENPKLFIGSYTLTEPLHLQEKRLYDKYGRIYGGFEGRSPVLTVAEPELVKKILVKDFHVFPNRRDLKCNDPIMDNSLFALENHDWKRVRNIVSPTFTSAKLRKMLPMLETVSNNILEKFEKCRRNNETAICQSIFKGFTLSAIGECAFGIKLNPDDEETFIYQASNLLSCNFSFRTILIIFFPKLMKIFKISLLNPEVQKYYKNLVTDVMCCRKENNEKRSDFLQRLMDAEHVKADPNNNNITKMDNTKICDDNGNSGLPLIHEKSGLTPDESTAQCVSFILAGFDATTSLLSHVSYHLGMHQDIQQRVYDEIKQSLARNNEDLSYETLSELTFLDAVLDETLRLCPSIAKIERRANADYEFKDYKIAIKKGMLVSIPIYAMHRDPEWYEDPEKFNPYRFLSEDLRPPLYAYLPFGGGPRLCIGKRFILMGVKMILSKLLLKYNIHLADKSQKLNIEEVRGTLRVENVAIKLSVR